jgi:hypothetical protein
MYHTLRESYATLLNLPLIQYLIYYSEAEDVASLLTAGPHTQYRCVASRD